MITTQPAVTAVLPVLFNNTNVPRFKIASHSVQIEITSDQPGNGSTDRKYKVKDISEANSGAIIMWASEAGIRLSDTRTVALYSAQNAELIRLSYNCLAPTLVLEIRSAKGEMLGEFTFDQGCTPCSIGTTYTLKSSNDQNLLSGSASVCCCCCCLVCQMICCMSKLIFPLESPITGNKICTGYVSNTHTTFRTAKIEFVQGNVSETEYILAVAVFVGVLDYELTKNSRRNEVKPT